MTNLAFTVFGRPQPAGSKKGFPIRRGDKIGVVITDANPRSKGWQGEVRRVAAEAAAGAVFSGPVVLSLKFYLARPRGHYGSGSRSNVIKASSPAHPIVKPDTTKLVRGVEDALTGVVWHDDAQVVRQTCSKHYGMPERCEVLVYPALASVGAVESEAA